MTKFLFRAGLAAVATAGLLTTAQAQPPVPLPAAPKVVRWPGGVLVTDGHEVILRNAVPGAGTTNIISGSGNGFGNKIVVGGGSGGGTTIISNSRNGIGNKIVLDPNDWVLDLDQWIGPALPLPAARPVPLPAPVQQLPAPLPVIEPVPAQQLPAPLPLPPAGPAVYEGKANAFWQLKAFSDELDCNIYWSATDKLWYRYHADCDKYKPLKDQPPAPKE